MLCDAARGHIVNNIEQAFEHADQLDHVGVFGLDLTQALPQAFALVLLSWRFAVHDLPQSNALTAPYVNKPVICTASITQASVIMSNASDQAKNE